MKSIYQYFAVCLGLLSLLLFGQHAYAVKYSGDTIKLGQHLLYIEDANTGLNINDIMLVPSNQWQRSQVDVPNFGYTDSAYWFTASIENKLSTKSDLLITVEYPLIDKIDVYLVRDNLVTHHFSTGDTRPFLSRPIKRDDFLFPVTLLPNENVQVYLRTQTEGATQLPIELSDAQAFLVDDQQELSMKHLYYGMMLVMVLYNLFLYTSVRERAYLYYVGFVSCFVLMQAAMHGLLFQYFYPSSPQFHQFSVLFLVPATMLFACAFSLSFLDLRKHSPLLYRLIKVMIVISALCVIGAFILPYSLSTQISVFSVAFASVFMMISGPVAWIKGQSSARFYTIAWFVLLIGTTSTALSKFSILPSNFFTEYGLIFGSALEALLLSFALADRLNDEKEARFRAQKLQLEEAQQRMDAEERLLFHSTHHAITGLPNRVLLFQRLEELIAEKHAFALVKVSMTRLDEVAKTLGQSCTDEVIKLFLSRLDTAFDIRSDDLIDITETERVSHFDKASFCFLLSSQQPSYFDRKLKRLSIALNTSLEYRDLHIDVGAQIGAARFPEDCNDAIELVRKTHIAMGFKSEGFLYNEELDPYNPRRLSLMGELQKAIQANQLSLYFQPQMDVSTGQVVGAEALVRWNHQTYGFIPPMDFIPHAEETGLIKPLTHWVLDNALFACRQWLNDGFELAVSINISAVNLHETNLVTDIQTLILKHNVPAQLVKIEITETAMMLNPDHALSVLSKLHDLGVKIAIDDFGTGHSSLSYIKRLPADEIKIDRSFVADMKENHDDEVIVSTTINMCHDLGYTVVAEGIEDEATLKALEAFSCDIAQGYYHSRPLPYDDFKHWITKYDCQAV